MGVIEVSTQVEWKGMLDCRLLRHENDLCLDRLIISAVETTTDPMGIYWHLLSTTTNLRLRH